MSRLNIFSGLLYSCNDDTVAGKAQCVGLYLTSSIDNSLSYLVPRVWSNPQKIGETHFSFDDFPASLLVLFEIISLEGWIDVMSTAMAIVGRDQQPEDLHSQWNSIFFLVFHLLGGCVVLALFVRYVYPLPKGIS
jgi:general stress protein CsbA